MVWCANGAIWIRTKRTRCNHTTGATKNFGIIIRILTNYTSKNMVLKQSIIAWVFLADGWRFHYVLYRVAAHGTVLRKTSLFIHGNLDFSPHQKYSPIRMKFCIIDYVHDVTKRAKNGWIQALQTKIGYTLSWMPHF